MAAGLPSSRLQYSMIVSPAGRTPAAAPPDAEAAVATVEGSNVLEGNKNYKPVNGDYVLFFVSSAVEDLKIKKEGKKHADPVSGPPRLRTTSKQRETVILYIFHSFVYSFSMAVLSLKCTGRHVEFHVLIVKI